MSQNIGRRKFIRKSAAVGMLAAGVTTVRKGDARADEPRSQVTVAVMGLSRGRALAKSFARQSDVRLKYVCDVDESRVQSCLQELKQENRPGAQGVTDFRKALDDAEVDVLVCAAPNHWHAPATILACKAGKHVYVEKPCSHTPQEGELMVQAARHYNRVVQMGTQRRSSRGTIQAMQQLRDGVIGRVYLARAYYNNLRGSIGQGKPSAPPPNIDYQLWQGPAPRRPYQDNFVHYNWHWRWHWGNGELGNNGVHSIDLCRWGLGVDYPIKISSDGGRYAYNDDQETPDTHTVCFQFDGERSISWQGLSCNKHGKDFVTFYGTEGTLVLAPNGTHRVYDRADRLKMEFTEPDDGGTAHIRNFLQAVRREEPQSLNAEIAEGHKSTLLCHLGNISHRTGQSIACESKNGHLKDNPAAQALWQREYEPGWEPEV